MVDSWKDYAGATRIGSKERMAERVKKAWEIEKRMLREGFQMDVPLMTEMAHKHIADKEDREKFIAIIETMAINPDLLTEEQFTFYYDWHEYIDCQETVEWNEKQNEEYDEGTCDEDFGHSDEK